MTYKIGMVSQKGGVGKSTLACMMAREFVAGGLSTKSADLDVSVRFPRSDGEMAFLLDVHHR